MALSLTYTNQGSSTTDAASYSANMGVTTGKLGLIWIFNSKASSPTIPTISGSGTYVQVATAVAGTRRATLFAGTGAASTVDFGGVTQTSFCWNTQQWEGLIQPVVVQGKGGAAQSSSSAIITLDSPLVVLSTSTATVGGFTTDNGGAAFTAGTGFTKTADFSEVSPSTRYTSEYDINPTDEIVDIGVPFGTWAGVAAEITDNPTVFGSFSGTGSFSATGSGVWGVVGSFSATATINATANANFGVGASFAGVGSFEVPVFVTNHAVGSFAGVGSFAISEGLTFDQYDAPEAKVYIETTAGVWVEMTNDLISGSTNRGRNNEMDRYQTGTATLVLRNLERKYDPVNEAGPLYGYLDVRHRVKIEAIHNTVTYPIFLGYIDEISEGRALSNTMATATIKLSDFFKVLNKAEVNGTSFSSQLSGARMNTVLDLVSLPAGLRQIDAGVETLQAMVDVSSKLLSHLQTVSQTEFGDFFVKANGVVRFRSRNAALSEPLQATFGDGPTEHHYNSLTPQYNDSLIRNPVSVDRVGGVKQTVEDTALTAVPPAGYGKNHYSLSGTYHLNDANALSAANYILGRYKLPQRRVVGLGIGPVPFVEGPLTYPQMLGRELTERILVVERPMGIGSDVRQESVIEGIQHDFSPGRWVTKWNVSPGFAVGSFWTLGVSQLGTETILYF